MSSGPRPTAEIWEKLIAQPWTAPWLLSLVLHLAMLITLGVAFHIPVKQGGGISLFVALDSGSNSPAKFDGDRDGPGVMISPGTPASSANATTAPASSLQQLLASGPPIDPTQVLPTGTVPVGAGTLEGSGVGSALVGLIIGLIPAWGVARVMQSFIFGVKAADAAAFDQFLAFPVRQGAILLVKGPILQFQDLHDQAAAGLGAQGVVQGHEAPAQQLELGLAQILAVRRLDQLLLELEDHGLELGPDLLQEVEVGFLELRVLGEQFHLFRNPRRMH